MLSVCTSWKALDEFLIWTLCFLMTSCRFCLGKSPASLNCSDLDCQALVEAVEEYARHNLVKINIFFKVLSQIYWNPCKVLVGTTTHNPKGSNTNRVTGLLIGLLLLRPLKGSLKVMTGPLLVWYCFKIQKPTTGCPRNALCERGKDLKSKVFGQLWTSPLSWPWLQPSLPCRASLLCLIHPRFFGRDFKEECWKLKTLSWSFVNDVCVSNTELNKEAGYQTCGQHQPEVWQISDCCIRALNTQQICENRKIISSCHLCHQHRAKPSWPNGKVLVVGRLPVRLYTPGEILWRFFQWACFLQTIRL